LSHYSSHNQYEGDEDWKINQYKYALRSEIDKIVGQQDFTCLYDMVRNSLVAEASIAKINREKGLVIKKKKDKYHQQLKPKGYPQKGKQPQSPVIYPTYKDSGRSHMGESMKGSRICYSCKQSEHFITDFPNKKGKTGAKSTTTSKCRVYYLDGMKAQANIDLIAGMFHLGQNLVRVLFDCGITNSFI